LKFQWGALTRLSRFAWALIVAGAVSNIGERLLLGSVRDYIRLSTGIFNLADGYILMGMFILLWVSHTPNPKK
jgi:lipoprotein signal peptidase